MAIKLSEHTYAGHIYMKLLLPSGHVAEVDVSLHADGLHYRTTGDHSEALRQQIIDAFHSLY